MKCIYIRIYTHIPRKGLLTKDSNMEVFVLSRLIHIGSQVAFNFL